MDVFTRLAELLEQGQPVALCTVTRTSGSVPRHAGSKMLIFPDGSIEGTIGGGEMEARVAEVALETLQNGQPQTLSYTLNDPSAGDPGVCGGTVEVFVDPINSQPKLLIVGAGHVGQSIAHLADWLGFRVEVSDDRPEFCTPEAVPQAQAFYPGPLTEQMNSLQITPQTFIVLSTRNLEVDTQALPGLLDSPAAYIGVIGSRRRWATARKQLVELGLGDTQLDRIHSPMGLEIHAETPHEIAVSILAEIIMIQRGGDGRPMSS